MYEIQTTKPPISKNFFVATAFKAELEKVVKFVCRVFSVLLNAVINCQPFLTGLCQFLQVALTKNSNDNCWVNNNNRLRLLSFQNSCWFTSTTNLVNSAMTVSWCQKQFSSISTNTDFADISVRRSTL